MRKLKNQDGQTLVEFALILPLFLTVMFAIFQFGFLFYNYISINQAAREGARHAAVGASNEAITSKVESSVVLDPSKLSIVITPADKRTSGDEVTVTVSVANADLLKLPFVDTFLPDKLEGKVVMRVEKDYSPAP